MATMFECLSATQKSIVFDKTGKAVVRACPGSGKTFSVAARLAYRMQNWNKPAQGIASISFTNVAWQEIEKKLVDNFNIKSLSYPHFLGTIDSFINNYIFLPHGHLVMKCARRPVLIGEPHSSWNVKRYDTDYDQYFDILSYGINEELTYPEIQGTFFFPYSQIYKADGTESKHAEHLRATKNKYWKLGYANQHDANYFALKILEKFPQIARALVCRFPELLLDEAQDTNEIQMRILDILCDHGLSDIILVGDPDQAIFEWNNANPKLFKGKFESWKDNSILLNDNRRSSQVICNATFRLSTLDEISIAVAQDLQEVICEPEIVLFNPDDIQPAIDTFLQRCNDINIEANAENIAILCRSKSFVSSILGNPVLNEKWTEDYSFTYTLIHACFLFQRGLLRPAFKLIEGAIYKIKTNTAVVSKADIEKFVEKVGFLKHRSSIHAFLKQFPPVTGELGSWVDLANQQLHASNMTLSILEHARTLAIEKLFSLTDDDIPNLNFTAGTVHSVKGETFEAVLLFLKTRGIGRNYTTLIKNNISTDDEEELRIVYVGITRPRQFFMLAVPNEANKKAWEEKLLQ